MPKEKTIVVERLPQSSSITSIHLMSAFIYGSIRQQKRIEMFGRLNRKVLRGIGRPAAQDGTTSAK
ncbi:MAG: hypothetical protein WCC97_10800 [Candidatus Acidiferrales bacterium]